MPTQTTDIPSPVREHNPDELVNILEELKNLYTFGLKRIQKYIDAKGLVTKEKINYSKPINSRIVHL